MDQILTYSKKLYNERVFDLPGFLRILGRE